MATKVVDPATVRDNEFVVDYAGCAKTVTDALEAFLVYSEEEKVLWKRFHGCIISLTNDMVQSTTGNSSQRLSGIVNNCERIFPGVSGRFVLGATYNIIPENTDNDRRTSIILTAQAVFLVALIVGNKEVQKMNQDHGVSGFHLAMCMMFEQTYAGILPIISQCITFKRDEPIFVPNLFEGQIQGETPLAPSELTSDEYLGKYLDACLSEDSLRAIFATSDREKIGKLNPWCGCMKIYEGETPKTLSRPKIGPLYGVSDVVVPGMDAVVPLEVFETNWAKMTNGLFDGMDWENTIVAGGAVLSCLLPGFSLDDYGENGKHFAEKLIRDAGLPMETTTEDLEKRGICALNGFERSDIDIFLYGISSDEEASDKVEKIFQMVKKNSGGDAVFMRSQHAITLLGRNPHRDIQIVLRMYNKPSEVILGFDIDSVAVAYDGTDVYATERALLALRSRTNVVNVTRRSTTYGKRLTKYASRGFAVSVPGYLRDFGLPVPLTGSGKRQLINSVEAITTDANCKEPNNNARSQLFGTFKKSLTEYNYLRALNPYRAQISVPVPVGASDLIHVILYDLEIMRSHYSSANGNEECTFDKRMIGGISNIDNSQKHDKLRTWFVSILKRNAIENKEAVDNVRITRKNADNDWKAFNEFVEEARNGQDTMGNAGELEFYELNKEERDATLPANAETFVDPLSVAFNIISDYATPMSSGFHSDECIEWAINNPREVNGLHIGGWNYIFNDNNDQEKIDTIEFMRVNPGSQGPTVSNTHGILMTASFHPSSTPGFYGGYRRLVGRPLTIHDGEDENMAGIRNNEYSEYLKHFSPEVASKIACSFIFTHFSCIPTFIYDVLKISEEENNAKQSIERKMEKINNAVSLVGALKSIQKARNVAMQGIHSVQESMAVINSVEASSLMKTNPQLSIICRQVLSWPSMGTTDLRTIEQELTQFCSDNKEISHKEYIETQVSLLDGTLATLAVANERKDDYKYWEDLINKINDIENHLSEEAKSVFLNLSMGSEMINENNNELIQSISNHPNPTVPPMLFKLIACAPITPITSFGPYIMLKNEINQLEKNKEFKVEPMLYRTGNTEFHHDNNRGLAVMVSEVDKPEAENDVPRGALMKEYKYYGTVNLRYEGDIIDNARAILLAPVLYGAKSVHGTRTIVCLSADYSDLIVKDESVPPSIGTYATLIASSSSGICNPMELAQIMIEIITALQVGYKNIGLSHGCINKECIRIASCKGNPSISVYGFGLTEKAIPIQNGGIKEDFIALSKLIKGLFTDSLLGTRLMEILNEMEEGKAQEPEALLMKLNEITPNTSTLSLTIPANKIITAIRSDVRQQRTSKKTVYKLDRTSPRICEDLLNMVLSTDSDSRKGIEFIYEEHEQEIIDNEAENMNNEEKGKDKDKKKNEVKDVLSERNEILNRFFTEIQTNKNFLPFNNESETFKHGFAFTSPMYVSTLLPRRLLDAAGMNALTGFGGLLGIMFANSIPFSEEARKIIPHSLLHILHYGPAFKYTTYDPLTAARDMVHDIADGLKDSDYSKLLEALEMEITGTPSTHEDKLHFEFICPENGIKYTYDSSSPDEQDASVVKAPSLSWFCVAMANSYLLNVRANAYNLIWEGFNTCGMGQLGYGVTNSLNLIELLSDNIFELMLLRPDIIG